MFYAYKVIRKARGIGCACRNGSQENTGPTLGPAPSGTFRKVKNQELPKVC